MAESIGGKAILKTRVDVPEERKFTGFDGYLKAFEFAESSPFPAQSDAYDGIYA
jgi:hypothetical protein